MVRKRTQNELRCFCRTTPLLAMYGVDVKGAIYIHMKIYKQRRIFGEIVVTGGVVKLHCRECLRWHTVTIRQAGNVILAETDTPEVIVDNSGIQMLDG